MLTLKNIVKDYYVGDQTVHALKGISVSFRENEFVSILGPSGCGKTTIMNIIGGLDRTTSGDLIINGTSTIDYEDSDWDNYRNKRIGFIFQSYNLIPHLSVIGNVEMALTISGISKEERYQRAFDALKEVGLEKQIKQRPNQLSGGQMQRVAIARALVNNPEVLLADEPTGALDTETSIQIMELIKKVAKEKLVIMVTHNPELAKKYSTRVIKMLDGNILDDSKPYEGSKVKQEVIKSNKKSKKDKTGMSYLTALGLSWRNLITKKGRTLLTAIAGSIGIIGIALILALSNGVNNYVADLQRDMLASYPITVSESSFDMNQVMSMGNNAELFEKFPQLKTIYVEKALDMSQLLKKNHITQDYIEYIEANLDKSSYSDITYKTGLHLNIYGIKPNQTIYSNLNPKVNNAVGSPFGTNTSSPWQMMLKDDFINQQYDLLEGNFPTSSNEVVVIVKDTNQIPEETLISLGLRNAGDEETEYAFSDIVGKEYKLVDNNLLYKKDGNKFVENNYDEILYNNAKTLTISGILRVKDTVDSGVLSSGIGYTKALYEEYQLLNKESDLVKFMEVNLNTNPFTGLEYQNSLVSTKEELRDKDYRASGGELLANEINIYPTSFEGKNNIKDVLNGYNKDKESSDMITYMDLSELIGNTLTSFVNIITYVLIAFTAISLVVSSIMIAIITYVSVIERTKEIGVLRSIGARKKDVTRVFNSETIIIGLIAGIVGVGFAYIVSIPVNIIVNSLVGVQGIASLSIVAALVLILISVGLTLLSGLVPAKKAAKQDPVTALRTE